MMSVAFCLEDDHSKPSWPLAPVMKDETDSDIEPWQPCPGDRSLYDGPDMPSTDLPEEHTAPEPSITPLDTTRLHKVKGYEDTSYHSSGQGPSITPPPYGEVDAHDVMLRPEEQFTHLPHISAEQAREALMDFVTQKCCYGKKAALRMDIHRITPTSALYYTLETYTETRGTTWVVEPYTGQTIDSPLCGSAPGPWEIHCNPNQTFHDEVHNLEVPHTATLSNCHGCSAQGWNRCYGCYGRGFKRCMACQGSGRDWKTDAHGHRHVESCWHCHGTGRKRCILCVGDGRIVCRVCQGYRQVKCYIRLTITYKNNLLDHIIERTDMPDHLVKYVHGETVFEQTEPRVFAIGNYPDQELCGASHHLVEEHAEKYGTSTRIIIQRQKLQAVPVSECAFCYKGREGRFWVYGKEDAVYCSEYPDRCCWGCSIL